MTLHTPEMIDQQQRARSIVEVRRDDVGWAIAWGESLRDEEAWGEDDPLEQNAVLERLRAALGDDSTP